MEKRIILTVQDMHCSNCAMRLQALEDKVPGILQVDASYQKQRMEVVFDESMISETGILDAVKNAGYTAVIK